MLQNAGVLYILPCKCASRHSGVQFYDIKPPKSGPYPSVFPHFDLQICFAPQRRIVTANVAVRKDIHMMVADSEMSSSLLYSDTRIVS